MGSPEPYITSHIITHRSGIIIQKISQQSATNATSTEGEKRKAFNWAARLKRAFNIDIKICEACSGSGGVTVLMRLCSHKTEWEGFLSNTSIINTLIDRTVVEPLE